MIFLHFGFPFVFFTMWQLEASGYDENNVRGCADTFPYRELHSEKFTFFCHLLTPPGAFPPRTLPQGRGLRTLPEDVALRALHCWSGQVFHGLVMIVYVWRRKWFHLIRQI